MDESLIELVAQTLKRKPEDIKDIQVLKKGMTNRSFTFTCGGKKYIIRIPGEGTAELIDRDKEYAVYQKIIPLGICDDVIYINPVSGIKITVYWDNSRVCDPLNPGDVNSCMHILRQFHGRNLEVPHSFDVMERILFYESLLSRPSCFDDHARTTEQIKKIATWTDTLNVTKSLAHIDAVHDNFLFLPDNIPDSKVNDIRLIDWEYSGMADKHIDIAMFAVYAMYGREHIEKLIDSYFTGNCDKQTRAKIYAYIAMCGLLWSNWCEYKRQNGVEFGEYALKQYLFAKDYSRIFKEYTGMV